MKYTFSKDMEEELESNFSPGLTISELSEEEFYEIEETRQVTFSEQTQKENELDREEERKLEEELNNADIIRKSSIDHDWAMP